MPTEALHMAHCCDAFLNSAQGLIPVRLLEEKQEDNMASRSRSGIFAIAIGNYGGKRQQKSSLPRYRTPSVLRVIQNPFRKVIFVKKAPRNHSSHREKKNQRTNNGTFDFSVFFFNGQNFPQRTYFFKMFFDIIQGKNLI